MYLPLMLIIDTALDKAVIAVSRGVDILASRQMNDQKEQAAWLQPAIASLFEDLNLTLQAVDAVAVSAGPGSYTGLRIALSTAKGICYALDKKLICIDTLRIMAETVRPDIDIQGVLCPMIDARRMEVYMAVYDLNGNQLQEAEAVILEPETLERWAGRGNIYLFGSGAEKCKDLLKTPGLVWSVMADTTTATTRLAAEMYAQQAFSDLAYAEPHYVKAFYSPGKAKT
ncbi:tRNA (adenosine(37)-N6)-threonylcarbamoyltransferase complex dimerization subunit type 1 TsaB [Flavihumibacter petaseus]|uniref:Peptidase M22 family protein n=1 Tax=Flavihumibacter petaseus NBRC 106054 TaxID=1220578 RepID=A0A0E9N633_9BACT|nr:tRNA (adenosine(37)-N6)-threonylcarbamoyltransferase complex dimerization subunit type 1 TsaB [Flavihumibacter petaseus]GAO45289.1 peptidase M22 family protein [Flavihumibacter petaseus NBRC 106054]